MHKKALLCCLIFCSVAITDASAQRFGRNKRYTSIGVSVNAMNYFGDITPAETFVSTDLKFTRYNIGLHLTRRYTPRFSGRASFNYGRLAADDYKVQNPTDDNARFRYIRNASFRTSVFELSAVGVFDLVENRQTYLRRPDFVPYLFGGVAGFYYNPKAQAPAQFGGSWTALQPLRTEGISYSLIQVAIPFGVGFRYKASPRLDIAFEIGYRYLFTDYLDDVSGNYPAASALSSELAGAFSNRTADPNAANGASRDLPRVLSDIGYDNISNLYGYKNPDPDNPGYLTVQGYAPREKRGSPNEKDWYLITGFHINYILVKGVRCPKFR